mmetsp:Transcript_21329/g.50108  ORF Transcript_21329/g.50108 Transcript_21329/m.50108 type:complete len:300 (-) Transcript_21329:186-1085(-)
MTSPYRTRHLFTSRSRSSIRSRTFLREAAADSRFRTRRISRRHWVSCSFVMALSGLYWTCCLLAPPVVVVIFVPPTSPTGTPSSRLDPNNPKFFDAAAFVFLAAAKPDAAVAFGCAFGLPFFAPDEPDLALRNPVGWCLAGAVLGGDDVATAATASTTGGASMGLGTSTGTGSAVGSPPSSRLAAAPTSPSMLEERSRAAMPLAPFFDRLFAPFEGLLDLRLSPAVDRLADTPARASTDSCIVQLLPAASSASVLIARFRVPAIVELILVVKTSSTVFLTSDSSPGQVCLLPPPFHVWR